MNSIQKLIIALYNLLLKRNIANNTIKTNIILAFGKIWQKKNRYTEKSYDILMDKTKIFIKIYRIIGIYKNQYYAVFFKIFTGKTKKYYIYFINIKIM